MERSLTVLARLSAYNGAAAAATAAAVSLAHTALTVRAEQQSHGGPGRPGQLALAGALQRLLTPGFCALIAQTLAEAEPGNTTYQRDLSVSYNKLADLAVQAGQGDRARQLYEQSLAIAQTLASARSLGREEELDRVLHGLTDPYGPHFWLVIAPPQLGKSWFLDRIRTDPALSGPYRWVIRLVDPRAESPELRRSARALLARFFDRPSAESGPEELVGIAQEIARNGMPHLCMLDSAELLDARAAATLRSDLSQIYRLVQDSAREDVRLALIIASRQEEAWLGVVPGVDLGCDGPGTQSGDVEKPGPPSPRA